MGIIKQGILGGFKNKVGSVVGSSWKGLATMRALPLSVANPKTASQVANRTRFSACAAFASLILASLIKPLMDRFALHMSGYNMFTHLNKDVWADPENPEWADLVISHGRMLPATNITYTGPIGTGGFTFTAPTGDKYALPTDEVYALVINETKNQIVFQGDAGVKRTAAGFTKPMTGVTSGDTIGIYISYLRADGSEVSMSAYGSKTFS